MSSDKKNTHLITDETLSYNRSLYKNLEAVQDALNKRMQKELHGVRGGATKSTTPTKKSSKISSPVCNP